MRQSLFLCYHLLIVIFHMNSLEPTFAPPPICKKASDTGSAEEGDHIIYHPLFRVKGGDTIDDDARTIGIRKYSSKLGHIFTVS